MQIKWSDLICFKRTFTEPFPEQLLTESVTVNEICVTVEFPDGGLFLNSGTDLIYGICFEYEERNLDFDPKYLINNNIRTSVKKLIPPVSLYKLETNYRNLYLSLLDQNNTNNNTNNNNNNVKEEKVK